MPLDPYSSAEVEDSPERLVYGRQVAAGEMADQVAKAFGIDSGGLLDQDMGRPSMDFDLRLRRAHKAP
jgi:hypothetical protein